MHRAMEDDREPTRPHRRDFLRDITATLGSTAAVGVTGAGLARGDEPPASKPGAATADPSITAEVDARMALIVARFGDRIDSKARETVRGQVERHVKRGRSLRNFKLENGDGPFPVFTPFRARMGED